MTNRIETVSVIIPNWNGEHLLRLCLDSLRKQTFQDFIVYIVDNGSIDQSIHLLEDEYPEVVVLRHCENLGFSAAINTGIENSRGVYIAALNNDTEAHPAWLETIVTAMDTRTDAGFCASQLMDFKSRDKIDSLGDGYYPFGVSFKIGSGRLNNVHEITEVQSACAAASVYRREMLEKIGLFDTDFFAYMEDIDLGLRAQMAGYSCIFVPGAIVYHMGSASSGGKASAFSVRLTTRNTYRVILKNVPAVLIPVYLVCTFGAQMVALLMSLIVGKPRSLRDHRAAFFSGLFAALKEAGDSIRKRRALATLRSETASQFIATTIRSIRLNRSL
ncbi:glycosyltransferase family 2 protein [Sneathiella litorea]|uniref:Glycosyltransferase n=1 Tax=Sneathiella litorea TaxID=2606216 RepID=A0A6L8WD84_9PROT|nr:glycosyltransferase family 2 protein [Sneathiella litorea]MZR32400.1 glycosyltransferase [Sneathiella litorea]